MAMPPRRYGYHMVQDWTELTHLADARGRDRGFVEGIEPASPVHPKALLQLPVKLRRRHHVCALSDSVERLGERRRDDALVLPSCEVSPGQVRNKQSQKKNKHGTFAKMSHEGSVT